MTDTHKKLAEEIADRWVDTRRIEPDQRASLISELMDAFNRGRAQGAHEASVSDKERADEVWEKAFMHWRRGEYRKRLPADIIASTLAAVRVEATQSIIKKLRTALEKSHAHSASLMAFDDAARILTQDTERL